MAYNPGEQVRLSSDPGRMGVVLNTPPQEQGDYKKYRIQFPDRKQWVPEYELELVKGDNSDPFEIIQSAKYGRPPDLRRSLTHIQLSGRLANLVYSMDATNVEFFAYQYMPVLRYLDSPSNGLLIADEVGLGKTIEAGLIWTELRARYDARRLVVFCPAMLREKWQAELRQRFGVDAEIVDAERLLQVLQTPRHRTPDGRGYICSLQGTRPRRGWQDGENNDGPASRLARFLDESINEEYLIDLAVFDEAHYMRNEESLTARLGELVRGVTEHLILLSATPINLRNEDLFNLLRLVDPDTFNEQGLFPAVLAANEPIQRARTLARDRSSNALEIIEQLQIAQSHEVLRESEQLAQLLSDGVKEEFLTEDSYRVALADRIDRINLLSNAVSRTRKSEVTEWRVLREPKAQFIELDEDGPEWDFYQRVTQAIREYAQRKGTTEGFLLASPQRQVASCMVAAAESWLEGETVDDTIVYEGVGAEVEADIAFEDSAPLISYIQREVMPHINAADLRKVDTKYKKLSEVLREFFLENPAEKIIIFSYFRRAVSYLAERLEQDGIACMTLLGGMQRTKQEIIDEFRSRQDIRIIISTEVASEGVDLQFCKVLVNYDLPWNPMRVEQRIGRLDRIGQQAKKIFIWNLFHRNTIDERIYTRLMERLGIFERALGGMEAVLGDTIQNLTAELLSQPLSEEEERSRIEQTALAVEKIRKDQDELEAQASQLIAHGGYILEKVRAAHEFKRRITSEDLETYVRDFLEHSCPGHIFQNINPGGNEKLYRIQLPVKVAARLEEFLRSKNLIGQTRLSAGEPVEAIFKNRVRMAGERREIINQFHPLTRFIAEEINRGDGGFYPVAAIQLRDGVDGVTPGTYIYVVDQWTFSGLRTEEVLNAKCLRINDGYELDANVSWGLINSARLQGEDWSSVSSEVEAARVEVLLHKAIDFLQKAYEHVKKEKQAENSDRINFQILSARNRLRREIASADQRIRTLQERGLRRQLPAAIKKRENIESRFRVQLEKLENRASLKSSREELCVGVIRVL